MGGMRWFKWGLLFSIVLFVAIYFLIYTKTGTGALLKLGKMDVTFLGKFFSSLKNVIITSLIVGFLLGLLTGRGPRDRPPN